jgi:Uma2 family endonuclease
MPQNTALQWVETVEPPIPKTSHLKVISSHPQSIEAKVLPPESQSVLLYPISWKTYDSLFNDLVDKSAVRLTYAQGYLEITMTLSPEHEEYSSLIHDLIVILSDELDIEIRPIGSTTLRHQELERGLESDNSYYIQHENLVRNRQKRRTLDLNQLPPPDLVVEIDITHHSIKKLPIYLALGVPEVWRYDGKELQIYQWREEQYVQCEESHTFAQLPLQTVIPELIEQSFSQGNRTVRKIFREWVRKQQQSD